MKHKKILAQAIVLLGLFAMALSFNGNSMRKNEVKGGRFELSNDSVPEDTTFTDNEFYDLEYFRDLSSSFNEKGFYKSNSFNKNGNEIINDFNGNLCYQIPLSSGKDKGDLYYDLCFNYNGNVNYQVVCGFFLQPYIYNFSAPGWIFSLNGLAIQMLNYETEYFTTSETNEAIGNDVHLHPNGYSFTSKLKNGNVTERDKITIMLGDGSTETLQNTISNCDTGNYYSTSKNSFMKAKVEYYLATTTYNYRTMYLMKGDGLTYIFKEYRFTYHDIGNEVYAVPKTFLLQSIKDRFGHVDSLTYNPISYGRPMIKSCPGANFNLISTFGSFDGLNVTLNTFLDNNIYKFITVSPFDTANRADHRPVLDYIENPSHEQMKFSYQHYYRTGNGLMNPTTPNMSIKFTLAYPLHRLEVVENFDGGKKYYSYLSAGSNVLNYIYQNYEIYVHSDSNGYLGQGRDLFFSNMVESVTENDKNVDKNITTYSYEYIHPGRYFNEPMVTNIWSYPIDPIDEYITTKTITSLDSTNLNNTPSSLQTRKCWRNFRTHYLPQGELMDFEGSIKLFEERYYRDNDTSTFRKLNYYYYKGAPDSYNVYKGSFLDSVKIEYNRDENNQDVARRWMYEYIGGDSSRLPMTMKREYDPYDRITTTYFRNFDKEKYRVFYDAEYMWAPQEYDSTFYYSIHMLDSIIVSKNNTRLQKKEITYYNPEQVTGQSIVSGYPGQVCEEKEINPVTNALLRKNSFFYFSRDTTGRYIWYDTNIFRNANEGNLKIMVDANGNTTRCFYDIISNSENVNYYIPPPPGDEYNNPKGRLSYHKMKDNGTDELNISSWRDFRFPSRVDKFIDGERYLSHYVLYNQIGNPIGIVDRNNYYSQMDYDQYFRLKALILPYDFNETPNDYASLMYFYDDDNNKVTIKNRLEKTGSTFRYKTIENYFDGFGYQIKTKISLPNDSGIYLSEYNYLHRLAKSVDANEDTTEFGYDKYSVLCKTDNADNSTSLVSNTFLSSINTTFYDVSNGCFNKQTYMDETGRYFDKYFDAVGNLIREVKYILYDNSTPDYPLDIDTSAYVPDNETLIPLYTDYCYDDLYRVTQVRTPTNKRIYFSYDALGRQSSRTTPDDGLTKYIYDKNNNLLFSQDANQRSRGTNIYTFRNYDGLNRLLSLGETQIGSPNPVFETLDTSEADFVGYNNEMLTVNVYDSLAYGSDSIFSNVPTDYYVIGVRNNTKGALVATAYKTNLSDSWSYKFYRYDARGRVIKMWHYIDGLGWKTMLYNYNSQNQVTYLNYSPSTNENKLYKYSYDSTARLMDVSIFTGIVSEEMEEDYPGEYFSYASYAYNRNSQILDYKINNGSLGFEYEYNNRNWVQKFRENYPSYSQNIFSYYLRYLPNGNVRNTVHWGIYDTLLGNNSNLVYTYIYDKSNRLLKANRDSSSITNSHDISMSYDNDGNVLSLKRYGSNENIIDNLTYSYYVNTNKINMVSGQDAQYTYDAAGNMTGDTRDPDDVKQDLKYDHRNLLTGMRVVKKSVGGDGYETYQLMYNYDEAGNRVRKRVYFYQGEDPTPVFEEDDMTGSWDLVGDEYYVRDVSGKEIAVYHSYDLDHWNVWGTDNVGKINANGDKFFYIKDHLGSVRVVLNSSNQIVSAIDYDCWGYPLENRSYQSDNIEYKFTGKQRDAETGYDYFGARYYDARIGRWGGVEPLLEKYISYSPYQYGLLNPIKMADAGGLLPRITTKGDLTIVDYKFYYVKQENDDKFGLSEEQISDLDDIESSMESWSVKGKFEVNVEFIPVEGKNFEQMRNIYNKEYDNYVLTPTGDVKLDEPGIGVELADIKKGETADRLYLSRNARLYATSGGHELSHLLGLDHPLARKDFVDNPNSNNSRYQVNSIAGPTVTYDQVHYLRAKPNSQDWDDVYEYNLRGLFKK